jgi:hypothetical protein
MQTVVITKERISQAEAQRALAIVMQAAVLALLDWGDRYYSGFMYRRGLDYLSRRYNVRDADLLSRSALFWKWWKNQWTLRNEGFIHQSKSTPAFGVTALRSDYLQLNRPDTLANEIFPNDKALKEMLKQGAEMRRLSPYAPII